MTEAQIRGLQRDLNEFTDKYLAYVTPLRVDGEMGAATKKRIRSVKWYLGYPKAERNAKAGAELRWRLNNPKKYSAKYALPRRLATGVTRRVKQRRVATANHKKLAAIAKQHKSGFGTFDGKTVAAWMIPWLEKSRQNGWHGAVVSGVRTPAYSEHLCLEMCGARSCPGRCAGRSSNHNMEPGQGQPHGALDVSDYINFGNIQHRIGSPLRNALPNDRVHFSASGR